MKKNTVEDIIARCAALPVEHDGCRIWQMWTDRDGYGTVSLAGKSTRVTRVLLEHKLGRPLSPAECACHTCDNPSCVEVDHLWAGTIAENNRDRAKKGRSHRGLKNPHWMWRSGEQHTQAKLTEAQVAEIRRRLATGDFTTQRAMAREYGVSAAAITNIKKGKSWATAY